MIEWLQRQIKQNTSGQQWAQTTQGKDLLKTIAFDKYLLQEKKNLYEKCLQTCGLFQKQSFNGKLMLQPILPPQRKLQQQQLTKLIHRLYPLPKNDNKYSHVRIYKQLNKNTIKKMKRQVKEGQNRKEKQQRRGRKRQRKKFQF